MCQSIIIVFVEGKKRKQKQSMEWRVTASLKNIFKGLFSDMFLFYFVRKKTRYKTTYILILTNFINKKKVLTDILCMVNLADHNNLHSRS